MKINKIGSLFIASFVLLFSACEPEVDEQNLQNTTNVEGVELVATQSTAGGNEITLEMVTPGITGYWDYNLGKALTNEVTVIYPIPGTATFTYVGTLGSEFFTKTIDVQIDELTHALNQDWYDLVSDDTAAGKTWVFDGGPAPDGRMWWFMSPPGSKDGAWTAWWNAAGDCCPPVDAAGKMKFDLGGAANFTYYADESAEGQLSSFVLDVANQKLIINNGNILGAEAPWGNPNGVYQIVSLTEDQLVLYVPSNDGGTGWTWVFVPEGSGETGGGSTDAEPTSAAPAPTANAANVISLFSDVYTDVTVDTWRTDWSSAAYTETTVDGNNVKLYSNLDFAGIETVSNQVDASAMTHFHVNYWTGNASVFRVKLVDFGPDGGFEGGDDTEDEIEFTVTPDTWVSLDIPLSDFTGLTTTENIAQYIFSAATAGEANVYIDNVYFHN